MLKAFESEKGFGPFKKFLSKGRVVDLESTLPPVTNAAWPSIYTGLKPGEHGVYDFLKIDESYNIHVLHYNPKAHLPFWEKLARKGYRCLLITPSTVVTLPESRNVEIITGFPLWYKTNNKELKQLMSRYDFNEEPHIETKLLNKEISLGEAVRRLAAEVVKKTEIAKQMLAKRSYDLVYVCVTETDKIQHFTLNRKDWKTHVRPVLRAAADLLQWAMERAECEGGEVMIVSDHGGRPSYHGFLVNNWLMRQGYLKLKDEFVKEQIASKVKETPGKDAYVSDFLRKHLYANMPLRLRGLTASKAFGKLLGAVANSYLELKPDSAEMSRTKAFTTIVSNTVAQIWLNDKRFKGGILSEKEKKAVKKELMKKLWQVKALDGSRLVVNVFDGERYYGKPKEFIAPDILFEVKEGYTAILNKFSLESDFIKLEANRGGDHTRYGIFGIYPQTRPLRKGLSVTDVSGFVLSHFS